jgi:hypothetical protein
MLCSLRSYYYCIAQRWAGMAADTGPTREENLKVRVVLGKTQPRVVQTSEIVMLLQELRLVGEGKP